MRSQEFRDSLGPRSLAGGQKSGHCADHPKRPSVWVRRGNGFIDTGMCASDMNRLERAFVLAQKAKATQAKIAAAKQITLTIDADALRDREDTAKAVERFASQFVTAPWVMRVDGKKIAEWKGVKS